MSKYRCPDCGETYSHNEYMALDRQPLNPEDDNPKEGSGYESICGECGAGFHSDKWTLRDEVETEDGTIEVSTVSLLIPHGLNHDDWFETCLFGPGGSRVIRRYHTQDEAEDGHEEVIEKLEAGEYTVQTTTTGIALEEDDA